MFVFPVLPGKLINNPAVAGIAKGVVLEMVKSEPGLVRMYLKVPFCKVSQLSTGVFRVPAISHVRVVACDVPLLTVTVLNTVSGLPAVFEIVAFVELKNVRGRVVKSTLQVVFNPCVSPSVLLMRLPPIAML